MGWISAFKVRMSGLQGRTKTDVLEALAAVLNEKTGECFPSTETIARVSRVSPNFVRQALKELEVEGLIQMKQSPGGIRHFELFLEKLPEPLKKPLPLSKSEGVAKPLGHPLPNGEYPPNETVRGPLTKPLPEQGIEQGIELGTDKGSSPTLALTPSEPEKPKRKRAAPKRRISFDENSRLPDDWREDLEAKYPTLNLDEEFERFVSWHQAKGTVYADWKAAFRNWLTNALRYAAQKAANNTNGGHRGSAIDRNFSYGTLDLSQFDYTQ